MKRMRSLVLAALAASLLGACGSYAGEGTAVPNSTIVINPDGIDWEAGAASLVEDLLQHYAIVVTGPGGGPQRGAQIEVYLDLEAGTSQLPIMQVWDGHENILSPNILTSPVFAKTDDSGTVHLNVVFPVGGGLEYRGNLQVLSGTNYGASTIEVTCSDC